MNSNRKRRAMKRGRDADFAGIPDSAAIGG
jgi:hypothetical protein